MKLVRTAYQNRNPTLKHYGVKGMKWGVRKADKRLEGVSRRTNSRAKKDAKEFARAKMYYGDGAGTRRKLIKAKVEQRAKENASYKKAFDHHLVNQNYEKHASKAKKERAVKDAAATTAKTARGIKNLALKTGANTSLLSMGLYAVYQTPQGRDLIDKGASKTANFSKKAIKEVRRTINREKIRRQFKHAAADPDELSHYGIKGMKWGVRKDKSSKSKAKHKGKKTVDIGGQERPKDPSKLTDQELQNAINRMNMEKNYKNLIQERSNSPTSIIQRELVSAGEHMVNRAKKDTLNYVYDTSKKNALKLGGQVINEAKKRR